MSDIRTRHYVSCAVFDPSPGHCDCGAMSESEAIATLTAELARVTAERDAALKDAGRWKEAAEFWYGKKTYPDRIGLAVGALDAWFENWQWSTKQADMDAAIAAREG